MDKIEYVYRVGQFVYLDFVCISYSGWFTRDPEVSKGGKQID